MKEKKTNHDAPSKPWWQCFRQTLLGLWPIIPLFQFGAAPPLRYNQPPANQLVSNVSMTILCDVAHFAPDALIMSMYVPWHTGRTRECTPTLCHPTNPRSTCRYAAWVPGKWDRLYSIVLLELQLMLLPERMSAIQGSLDLIYIPFVTFPPLTTNGTWCGDTRAPMSFGQIRLGRTRVLFRDLTRNKTFSLHGNATRVLDC